MRQSPWQFMKAASLDAFGVAVFAIFIGLAAIAFGA